MTSSIATTISGVVTLCVVLLWSTDRVDARPSLLSVFNSLDTDESARIRRDPAPGFRAGAADRFSHGFGKRSGGLSPLEKLLAPPEQMSDTVVMSDASLVRSMLKNPSILETFVRRYIDVDGDGYVSASELQQLTVD